MSSFDLDAIEWSNTAGKKIQKQCKKKIKRSLEEQTVRSENVLADSLQRLETFDYLEHPDSKGRSRIGWAMKQDANVVFRVENTKLESTVIGWTVPSIGSDPSSRDNFEFFFTQDEDILNLRVDEVASFAKLVVKCSHLQDSVNQISIRRPVVAVLFAGLYANALLITELIIATNTYLKSDSGTAGNDVVLLYIVSGYFILREALQFFSEGMGYLADPWNLLDIAKVGLTITSATVMWDGTMKEDKVELILLTTAVFVFGGVISFLRSAFLPFSKFVTGVREILVALLPFLVISFLVLLGFGYMYWVQRFECPGKCNLVDGFNSAYAFFVGGPDEIKNFLDIFTGFVLVIVLLNVVIAIVTTAWDDSSDTDEAFWRHRISFLIEVRSFLRLCACNGKDGKKREAGPDVIGSDIDARTNAIHESLCQSIPFVTRIKLHVRFISYKLFYLCLLLLGLVTFGFYWPCRIRAFVFGMNVTEATTSVQEEIVALKEEIRKLRSRPDNELHFELNELKKGMDEIRVLISSIPGVVSCTTNGTKMPGDNNEMNSSHSRGNRNIERRLSESPPIQKTSSS